MNNYQKKRLIEATQFEEHLTEWEIEFVNDLVEKGDDYELSEKQNSILNRISTKIARI